MVSLTSAGVERIRCHHDPGMKFREIVGRPAYGPELTWVLSGWIPGSLL